MTSPISPSLALAQRLQWLTAEGSSVAELRPEGPDTLALIVRAPGGEEYDPDEAAYIADYASVCIKDAIDGVKLVAKTAEGHEGEDGGFSADEVGSFLYGLPGVEDYACVEYDVDGDGTVGEDESANLFEVTSRADATRISELVDPNLSNSMDDAPVVYEVGGQRVQP